MLTFKPEVEGYHAHWEIQEPGMTFLYTEQFTNRIGLFVSLVATPGTLPFQTLFNDGNPVAIIIPDGEWKSEYSDNGNEYYPLSTFNSNGALSVNFILTPMPFPKRWIRYTKME